MGSQHAVGGFSSPLHIHALRALIQEGTHMTNLKLPRRKFLHLAVGAAALPSVSRTARTQAYPLRPVRIIVGFPAGGSGDIIARLMGQRLAERLGRPFVVENRPGAGTTVATEAVVKSAPDGHTLLMVSPAHAINATLYEKLNFHFLRDIAPVASLVRYPMVMVVHPSIPAKTAPEFIACQGQSGQAQHSVSRQRIAVSRGRRTVQDDDRRQYATCPVPGIGPRTDRSFQRTGSSHVRHDARID